MKSEEQQRIDERNSKLKNWNEWGPYLSERQWGTVREDYSDDGSAWDYFPYQDAKSRAYRWGEDAIGGLTDQYCNICFGFAFWNHKDDHLKERLFGLSGPQGNHGEDVKELYYHLENTPTHSYMKYLYKYPQDKFPYQQLIDENANRSKEEGEYEILDTGVFDENNYFDLEIEYAKSSEKDILIQLHIRNRSKSTAKLTVLPTLWMRNLWDQETLPKKPVIWSDKRKEKNNVFLEHPYAGSYHFYFECHDHHFFTENETNTEKIFGKENDHAFKKDVFHTAITSQEYDLPQQRDTGTKFSPVKAVEVDGEAMVTLRYRLSTHSLETPFDAHYAALFDTRKKECDAFYQPFLSQDKAVATVQRQAFAGILWSKQYYNYNVEKWLNDSLNQDKESKDRICGRNHEWKTLKNHDIHLMPDTWEYPWYAAWDSAFHCVTMALIDLEFAKEQLLLFTKEWYMAPNGQIPAYEWKFSDVNPPIQAWAALQISEIEKKHCGHYDIPFLKKIANKLALNFTWWVNRKDASNDNIFEGGFLGLDNIGLFDRSGEIPGGGRLEQVDGTSWMALFSLNMMEINIIIAQHDRSFEGMAVKYLGHFMYIAESLNAERMHLGNWHEKDGFFYDRLVLKDSKTILIKVRSMVGLLSLVAIAKINHKVLNALPEFKKSVAWFRARESKKTDKPVVRIINERGDLVLTLVPKDRALKLYKRLFDPKEFLSDYGFRSLSKVYEAPFSMKIKGEVYTIAYEPAESSSDLFGGNSNWRGPIWFPINFILLQSLRKYQLIAEDEMCALYSKSATHKESYQSIIEDVTQKLLRIFLPDKETNIRPVHQLHSDFYHREEQKDLLLFYEYFDGNIGRGVGSSHQTGWTALILNLIQDSLEANHIT